MAVRIRLRRIGKNPKKKPHFRVSVFDETRGRDSRSIEELGFYSPTSGTLKIKNERLDYWVKNGAQVSQALENIIKKTQKEK
ncbi:MAG: 30S ribosomal protein S16 [Deltaproteobacteria bacterium]